MLAELEQALRHEEMRVLTLGREIKDLTSLLDRLEADRREAEKQAMTSGHLLQQLESEFAKVNERLQTSGQELHRLEAERTEKASLLDQLKSQIAEAEQKRAELEVNAAIGQEQLSVLRERRNVAAENASHRLAKVATLEERHRSAAAVLERIESLVLEMMQRVEALRMQIESSAAETLQRETQNQELAIKLVDFDAERNACETRDSLLQFESEQVRARLRRSTRPFTMPASCSTSPATVAPNFRRPQPSCSPMPSTWLRAV